jgi:hypothetical protein
LLGYCVKSTGECRQCIASLHCKGTTPFCVSGSCVGCRSDKDCRDRLNRPHCLPSLQQCVSARRRADNSLKSAAAVDPPGPDG